MQTMPSLLKTLESYCNFKNLITLEGCVFMPRKSSYFPISFIYKESMNHNY